MTNKIILTAFTLCLFLIIACKKDNVDSDDNVNTNDQAILDIYFKGKVGSEEFVLNQTYTHDSLGYPYRFETVKLYFSNFTLTDVEGNKHNIDTVMFANFYNNHLSSGTKGELLSIKIPTGDYTNIKFNLGLDSALNHGDPSNFPNDHPLSTTNGAHWGWAGGYRFAMLEGKVDTSTLANGSLNYPFNYHTGFLSLLREINNCTSLSLTKDNTSELTINIDLGQVFVSGDSSIIDPKIESFTHAMGNDMPLAEKVTEHLTGAFSIIE